jgi:5-methylcytosine-specific restriction endonuclease McrA
MKEQILLLRSNGKTYNEIVKELGCAKSTVSYHCGQNQKQKTLDRQIKNRKKQHPYIRKMYRFKESIFHNQRTGELKNSVKKLIYSKIKGFQSMKDKKCGPSTFLFEDVLEKFGENPECYLTGEKINIYEPTSYQFDHKIPRSRGGTNELDNLGICVSQANQCKRDLNHKEFYELCKKVVEKYEK